MTEQYENACALVADKGNEIIDFQARKLVEMSAHIIMSYLLLIDSQSNADFIQSANIYINKSVAWNNERYSFIENFTQEQLDVYDAIKDEKSIEIQ